ncbi:MAG: hypothetical protein U1F43_03090 [Myxococcota bacterium]
MTAPGIEYYLAAVDASANANHATLPATAPTAVFSVAVTAPDVAGPTLELDPVATPVTAGTPVPVAVTATDASGVASVDLYFHKAGTSWQTLAMTAGADDRWTAVIPGASVVEGVLELYVSADDDVGNTATEPADGAADPIEVQVDPKPVDDVVAPVILHSPVSVVAHGEAAPISAVVTDASGVASVVVLYRADGESDFTSLALVDQGGGHWSGSIPATATLGASVDYYLEATDGAPAANVARDPEDAPSGLHTIDVLGGPDEDISVEAVETVEPGPEADTSVAEETTSPGDDTGPSTADEGSAAEAEAVVTHGGSDGGCAGGDVGGAQLGLLAAVGVLAALALARRRGALSAP